MKFCSNCGANMSDLARFCSSCGSATDEAPAGEVTTKKARKGLVVWTAYALLVIGGATAFALARGNGNDGPDERVNGAPAASVADGGNKNGYGEELTPYEQCMADSSRSIEECRSLRDTSSDSDMPPSDSEGYYPDSEGTSSTTCLEWKTNYTQKWVSSGLGALGGSTWNGSGWVQNSPQTGHWEQIPTGQTCVRWG